MKLLLPLCTGSSASTQCSSHPLWLLFRKSVHIPSRHRVLRALPRVSMRSHTSQYLGKIDKDNSLDPCGYTTGRWLRNDSEERAGRYIEFDFDQLCKRVVELCAGANSIDSVEKREGGFNRIFLFTCDNKKRIVARLPTKAAGPQRLTTHSEVATIHYLQNHTTVPIPKILEWSDDPSNGIGTEYIIMKHAKGIELHQKWPTMSVVQKMHCIKAIAKNIKQWVALQFSAYGSLYFANNPVDPALTKPVSEGYCLGPSCRTRYWDCNIGDARYYTLTKPNRGPWDYLTSYCDALIDTGLSRVPPPDEAPSRYPSFQGSVSEHVRLLRHGRDILHILSADLRIQQAAAATFHHADLHKRNIFVSEDDPTVVTDIIDWQSSSVEPAFEHADDVPDFLDYNPHASEDDERGYKTAGYCVTAYDSCLKALVPRFASARALDEDLLRPYRFCHRTWKDTIPIFRRDLIRFSGRWKELGLPGQCPYPTPTADELAYHKEHYEDFEIAQNLLKDLMSLLETCSDGWVPLQAWDKTAAFHKQCFEEILRTVKREEGKEGETLTEEKLRRMWPFDIPE